jgi:hypothetical protein
VPIRTVGFTLRNQAMIDVFNQPERYAAVQRGAPTFRIPTREENPLWDNGEPTYVERGRDVALYLNYKLGDFFFELAGNANQSPRVGNNAQRRGMQDTFIDILRTLPTGAPNPYYLERYSEYMEYMSDRRDDFTSARVQGIYVKDTRIGKFQVGGMAGATKHESTNRSRMLILPLTHLAPDARSWIDASELNEYAPYTRVYHNDKNRPYRAPNTSPITVIDPVTNTRTTVRPTWVYDTRREDNNLNSQREYKFLQAAGNFDLFKNRLVLIGAFRRDFTLLSSNRVISPGDNAAGWDGTTLTLRKTAPDDYRTLTYFPKDATGRITGPESPADARPRVAVNGANIPAAQYANDRFRDDFDSPALRGQVNTHTVGAVVNLTRWLGVYGNVATTFNLISPSQNAAGQLLPPTASEGKDVGMRITLPNGRLAMNLGWYSAFQAGSTVLVGDGFQGAYNAIADAPVVGDLTPAGRNARGVRRFPQNVWSTVTEETKGYEAEVNANLTPQWRLVLNGGYTDANRTNQFPDIVEYFKTQDAISRQILGDAGVIIDPSTNNATIDPRYDNPALINQQKVQAAVNGWNNLQNTVIPNFSARSTESQRVPQSVEWTGNLATDYRFRLGYLKGLRVGLGINYRGGQVVGFRGSDTIPNPANPAVAIDDPTVDALTPVIAKAYYKGSASFSYTWRLRDSRRIKSIQFDLNIDNLFNRREAIFGTSGNNSGSGTTVLVPRNGDISSPARVTIPGNFFYLAPRNYTFAAKLAF